MPATYDDVAKLLPADGEPDTAAIEAVEQSTEVTAALRSTLRDLEAQGARRPGPVTMRG